MNKKVIIIHGWDSSPDVNWFPWLKKELKEKGFEAKVPAMPNPANPKMDKWIKIIHETVGKPDENKIIIGHSLGVMAVIRYLETLKDDEKVGGIILVAGFLENQYSEVDSFYKESVNDKKIKKSANKIIAIHSDNDPFVPISNAGLFKKRLDAEIIILSKAGHINADSGFLELPIVLDKILKISK